MLKRVSIQNFKSLKDVTLDLQKVNLLIGPNNSGKTNFLKALEFLSRLNQDFNQIDTDSLFKKNQKVDLSIHIVSDDGLYEIFGGDKYVGYVVSPEVPRSKRLLAIDTIPYSLAIGKHTSNDPTASHKEADHVKPNNHLYDIHIQDVKYILQGLNIYKPDSNKLAKASIVGTGAKSVDADASNLIAFFDYIRDDQPEVFERIKADLRKCVPEFTEINFQSIPSNDELVKQFGPGTYKRLGLTDGRQGVKYWADELSEGTLYFLALLCIINQPNPPKLLMLEEPEKGIHPRRISEVVQFILRLVAEKDIQVIMTTHSPVMLDMFADMPESVFIFDKDDEGATHVKNLQRDVIEPDTAKSIELGMEPPRYTDALGDAWTIGFLGGVPK